jgi:hypothetical protein
MDNRRSRSREDQAIGEQTSQTLIETRPTIWTTPARRQSAQAIERLVELSIHSATPGAIQVKPRLASTA